MQEVTPKQTLEKMIAEPIKYCRLCQQAALRSVLSLGNLASCGVFPKADEPDAPTAPLELVQCENCGLVQLAHDFDGADLYRSNYGYRSGINESMVRHLGSIVTAIGACTKLQVGDIVLDIGSNDGTTLGLYPQEGLRRVGIDPTIARFAHYYKPGIIAVPDFFNWQNYAQVFGGEQAKVITSISMFYDLPDPTGFVADVARALRKDGIWVMEQSYLPAMIERNSFDTICHEHLEYYTLHQIRDLARGAGLKVIDVAFNDVNGGSFQVWLAHVEGPYSSDTQKIDAVLASEARDGYLSSAPIEALKQRLSVIGDQITSFLEEQRSQGKIVHGYGASTKGNTLLQYFGITSRELPVIAERNHEKFGSRTPGSGIPIISEAESRALLPDFYFVLPWHFRDGFIERERAFLDRGGHFVFPLPNFEIYPPDRRDR